MIFWNTNNRKRELVAVKKEFWFATYQTSYNLQGDFENHKHLSLLSVFSGRMVFVIFIKSLNIVSIVLYLLRTPNIYT